MAPRRSPPREAPVTPGPAKVKVAEVAVRPPPKAEEPAKAAEHDHDHGHDHAHEPVPAAPAAGAKPEIHTDAGRHSALTSAMGIVLLVVGALALRRSAYGAAA